MRRRVIGRKSRSASRTCARKYDLGLLPKRPAERSWQSPKCNLDSIKESSNAKDEVAPKSTRCKHTS